MQHQGQYKWYHVVECNLVLLTISHYFTPTIHDLGKLLLLQCAGKTLFSTCPVKQRKRQQKMVNNKVAPSFSIGLSFTVVQQAGLNVYATSEKFPDFLLSALGCEHCQQNFLKEISKLEAQFASRRSNTPILSKFSIQN